MSVRNTNFPLVRVLARAAGRSRPFMRVRGRPSKGFNKEMGDTSAPFFNAAQADAIARASLQYEIGFMIANSLRSVPALARLCTSYWRHKRVASLSASKGVSALG